jgi:hypothetical protein
MIFDAGLAGRLGHFAVHMDRLDAAAGYVADTIRLNYPALQVPFHARWRHFVIEGRDRWQQAINAGSVSLDPAERARQRFDLAITSVLLDAGAGPAWRWSEPIVDEGGALRMVPIGRSEGLALASFSAWRSGLFSSDRAEPLRADAAALHGLTVAGLGKAFRVAPDNPLEGLEGRVALLNRLGDTIEFSPDLFGSGRRLGCLYDTLAARAVAGRLPACEILRLLLQALGPIWPGRLSLDGIDLGDTWRHPAVETADATNGLVPFHKLSQWLSYSLIEPLLEAGITVTEIDGLTGLAEYRNGGLFLDLGVLSLRDPALATRPLHPGDEPIVEWRALTVSLLDEIAPRVRALLGRSATEMPLASVLEGGTWSAGRRIARERRADGGPPLRIISDGSVF